MALYLNAYSRTFSHSIRMNSKIEGWISLLHSACTCAMCMFTQSMRIFDFLCFSSFEFLRKEFCFAGTVFFISNQIDSPWCVCVCDYTITLTLRWIHSQTQTHAFYTIRPTVDGTKTSLNSLVKCTFSISYFERSQEHDYDYRLTWFIGDGCSSQNYIDVVALYSLMW